MNLQKMLNVFILIFLIVNVGLYFFIDWQDKDEYILSEERKDLLADVLDKENILLYKEPIDYYPRPELNVHQPVQLEKGLMEKMLGDDLGKMTIADESYAYEMGTEKLIFDHSNEKKPVFYSASEPTYVPKVYTKEGYDEIVKTFVEDFTLGEGQYVLTDDRKLEDENAYIYYFNEQFEGELIFSNEVVVKVVEKSGITEARAIRYEPYGYDDAVRELYGVDEAIYSLIAEVDKDPEEQWKITDIDIGYYIGQDDSNDIYNMSIEPYYRIKLSTGVTFFINAYTNELVQ